MSDTLRLSTRDIVRFVPDDEEAFPYRGDLTTGRQARLVRSVSFWPLGGGRQTLSGTLEIDNRSGRYDGLISMDVRDRVITLSGVLDQNVFEDGDRLTLATAVADTIEATDDRKIVVRITDPMAKLDRPLGRDSDPTLEDVTGGKTPVLIGLARNVRAPLADQADPVFRVNDRGVSAIANLRSRASPLTTEQWQFALQNAGFEMLVKPRGPITCDASTAGDAQLPPSPVNEFGALAQLDVDNWAGQSGSNPAGTTTDMPHGGSWRYRTRNGGVDGNWLTQPHTQNGETYASIRTGGTPGQTSTGWIEWEFAGSPFFEAGKTYRWSIDRDVAFTGVDNLTGGFMSHGQVVDRAYFQLVAGPPAGQFSSAVPNAYPPDRRIATFKSFDPSAAPGVYSGTWTCPESADGQRFILRMFGFNAFVRFRRIEFFEVEEPSEVTLEGVDLRGFVKDVAERSGQPVTAFDLGSLDNIDSQGHDVGFWTDRGVSTIRVLREVLDSHTADAFTGRDGVIQFTRLVDPAAVSPRHTITADDLKGRPRVRVLDAPGLTLSATARRNWFVFRDSDFVDNFDDVPLSLRARFSAAGQFTMNAEAPDTLPSQYAHAVDAPPLDTLYDQPQAARAELQRVADYFNQLRYDVTLEARMAAPPEPGEVVLFRYPRYPKAGFPQGRPMQIISVGDNVTGEAGELTHTLRLIG